MTPSPLPLPDVGIPTGSDPFDMVGRLMFFVIFLGSGVVVAMGARDLLRHWNRSAGPGLGKVLGRPPTPEWVATEWLCGDCRSFNHLTQDRCQRCRRTRFETELRPPARPLPDDVIPAPINATGRHVSLEHNGAAHADGLHGHWQLMVDGQVMGSASLRSGAIALLRCVEGTDEIGFDPHGRGLARYRLPELIAAFEGPRLPISEPCPEAVLVA